MNRNKQKGTRFETEVVDVFRRAGLVHVERRAQQGALDKGDIAGIPGWVIECKNTKAITLGEFMAEAEVEAKNAQVPDYAVVAKRRMKGAAEAYAVVPLRLLVDLIAHDGRPHAPRSLVGRADTFLDATKDIA